jgi:hypothetical protein
MSAADRRIAELLERWLASLELHGGYLDLDNEAYSRAQAWPPHQRPTRWIIDLAKTRTLDLKRMLGERQARGDTDFGDALELMSFLTTLLASEHVERFIPLAVAPKSGAVTQRAPAAPARPAPTTTARSEAPAAPKSQPPAAASPDAPPGDSAPDSSDTARVAKVATTPAPAPRVVPNARTAAPRAIPAARPATPARVIPQASVRNRNDGVAAKSSRADAGTSGRSRVTPTARTQNTGTQRAAAPRNAQASRAGDSSAARGSSPKSGASLSERVVNQVIADAVRMLDWGNEWPQLASMIARMADRPAEKDVWRILREHRATIESKAKTKARAG